jgi:ubiquinone biosynthesis protein
MQSFLRHAIGDGLFHADMHPGNLFADPKTGHIKAVDFGIMGRISQQEQRFLAEILYGFITRNYTRVAELHFAIGYVPKDKSVKDFALALRMIGEPMHGRKANDISMARVFGQLLKITELFDMQARPELILLQKNMALVEGVGRMLDPQMDIWSIAEPIVGDWIKQRAGPKGKLDEAGEHFERALSTLGQIPELVSRANGLLLAHKNELKRHQTHGNKNIKLMFGAVIFLLLVLIWRLW